VVFVVEMQPVFEGGGLLQLGSNMVC